MRIDIFTKQQMLEGYLNTANNELTRLWLTSVEYHQMDMIYDDMMCDYEYLYYDKDENLVGTCLAPNDRKELSLWDVVV